LDTYVDSQKNYDQEDLHINDTITNSEEVENNDYQDFMRDWDRLDGYKFDGSNDKNSDK
jgi:hypothetical protein